MALSSCSSRICLDQSWESLEPAFPVACHNINFLRVSYYLSKKNSAQIPQNWRPNLLGHERQEAHFLWKVLVNYLFERLIRGPCEIITSYIRRDCWAVVITLTLNYHTVIIFVKHHTVIIIHEPSHCDYHSNDVMDENIVGPWSEQINFPKHLLYYSVSVILVLSTVNILSGSSKQDDAGHWTAKCRSFEQISLL